MPKPKRKSNPVATHHAIAALRQQAAEFSASREVSSLVASDLAHDERAISQNPDQGFAWFISRNGTHMMRMGAPVDIVSALRYRDDGVQLTTCYRDASNLRDIAGEMTEYYIWDGSALVRHTSLDALVERFETISLRYALAEVEDRLAREVETMEPIEDDRLVVSDLRERIRLLKLELGMRR